MPDDDPPRQGWIRSTLADATTLSKNKVDPADVPDARYLGMEHVEAHTMRIIGSGRGSDVKSAKASFAAGDVLYGKLRPYLNKVARPTFDGICSTDFLVLSPSSQLDMGYLAHFLNQLWVANRAHHMSSGVELPRVDWQSLSSLPIAYPSSKSVQQEIVETIETARGLESSAHDRLNVARRALSRFRQAVLAAACSGRLTADWTAGPATVSAEAAIARKRESHRRQLGSKYREPFVPVSDQLPAIPDGWCWVALPEVGEMGRGKSKHRPRNDPRLYGGEYPFVQTGDVARSEGRVTSHSQTYNEVGLAQSKRWPERTVCITIAANIADSALLTYPACFPDSVVGIVTDESVALPEYIELFVRTARRDLAAFAPATAQANINLAILSMVAVALPSIDEQTEIVRRVSELYSFADEVALRIERASQRIDRTAQAVLAKAFRGELIS